MSDGWIDWWGRKGDCWVIFLSFIFYFFWDDEFSFVWVVMREWWIDCIVYVGCLICLNFGGWFLEEFYCFIWVLIVGNFFFLVFKLVVGFFYLSIVLILDGVYFFSDVVMSVIGYFGMRVFLKFFDKSYFFGYFCFEFLVVFFISEVFFLVVYEIGRDLFFRFFYGMVIEVNFLMFGVIVFFIFVKELMFCYFVYVGRKFKS